MRNRRAWSATRTVVAGLACGVLALALPGAHAGTGPGPTERAAPGEERTGRGDRNASVVIEWMRTADDTIDAEARTGPPESFIWQAYVSTAVYNAVVGVEGRFTPYKWDGRAHRPASSAAAAASAAHHVLRHHFPGAAPRLDAALADTLATVPDGEAEEEGVAFGKRAAAHIVALRRDDGRGASVPFPAPPGPGVWRPTPPGHQPFASAWMGRVRPLLLDSPGQFRPGPPPPLRSARYARDLHELAAYGGRTGSHRTPEQTDTARYFVALDLQGALGDHAARHGFGIAETARLYAAANTAQADAVIAAWDAKLHYGTWRPVTAIREADTDGNPATRPDRHWEPLLNTPAHPDYLSGHATMGGALMRMLTGILGTSRVDLRIRSVTTGATRHYHHADAYERDVVDARVWGGIHTRTADEAGAATGRQLAAWALRKYFRPLS
ncbi:vanadium-dependent haloperoxidase [Streptomyces sp. NPDC006132]|uniref:vanadium-dependent haloperoxidase n=1 Tax=Streptomyces sp. NPDC006132 TaxID=3156732 RepID=UPI0033D56A06